ncbi:TPR-like protein [Dioscorea alata]|uniref:TPR-like protein n=1 Tax=Dioscorea alata TaxID=55571 RepID=A0ACB7U801_DIOAL|nr:TPR-like protein [Dioscorea alata]
MLGKHIENARKAGRFTRRDGAAQEMIRKSGNKRHQTGIWHWCRSLRTLKQIHGLMVVRGFLSDPSALRELIFCSAISLPGAMYYALQLFDRIPDPDLFIWNTIIRGAAHTTTPLDAISLFARMERSFARPNKLTFPFLLRASSKLSSPFLGSQFHAKIVKFGFETDIFTKNALINLHANCGDLAVASSLFDDIARKDVVAWSSLVAGYAKRGQLDVARQLFDEMPCKDLVSWNVMITGYVKQGDMQNARELFDEVPQRDVVSWNAMIAGYVRCGSLKEAMKVFEEMHQAGERPDEVTMLSLLSACADSGALDVGEKIHQSILEIYPRSTNLSISLGNVLIDMYAKCGSIDNAFKVFRGMREKDVSTWNSIIGGLAFHGHAEESISLFEEMRKKSTKPNDITFVSVLVACSHAGMVEDGREYFKLMRTEYGIEPNVKHYGCMVDILGRAGHLEEAFGFVKDMKFEPNAIVWRTLLGACRIHGNVELGECANEELLKLRKGASGDYVLLSNIYASMGEWDGVEKVRKLMDDRGVSKEAGCAQIEGENSELIRFLLRKTKS